MLTKEQNERLTRVGPGTPMGNLMRQFWFPALPSSELPEPGGAPLRHRLLGEDLIIFRNTEGVVGLVAEACAHRGASLFFGRNEDCGLRCVYHGWLYDVDGRCVDMPNEPAGSSFKEKIRITAYPCREVNGVIWAYMGPRQEPPPLPEFSLTTVPEGQRFIRLTYRRCNWAQAVEGDLDGIHASYLHSPLRREDLYQNMVDRFTGERPRVEALDTDYGIVFSVRRTFDAEHDHIGVGHFFFPFFTQFARIGDETTVVPGHVWLPIDDETTLVWFLVYHPVEGPAIFAQGARSDAELYDRQWEDYLPPTSDAGGRWRERAVAENDYGLDYEAQRSRRYSGLPTVEIGDRAVQESMGPIVDRTREHLGTTDVAQIRFRQRVLKATLELQEHGRVPECVDDPAAYRLRSASGLLPKGAPWRGTTLPWLEERLGLPVRSKGHRAPE